MHVKTTEGVLKARAAMEEAVRAYFNSEGFVEVTTPVALPFPNLDPNIRPLSLLIRDFSGRPGRHWLHTSPELTMKKLIARGSGDIFQLTPVFRDEEVTPQHRCEFNMLEWYRTGADYEQVMEDTLNVIEKTCRSVRGSTSLSRSGKQWRLSGPWENVTMLEVFGRHAGVESFTGPAMVSALQALGCSPGRDDSLEDLFFKLYLDFVEPELGKEKPTIVRDFPRFLGTMAREKPGRPDILERFEVFIDGLELANGYSELTDARELKRRMELVRESLERDGVDGLFVDEDFLDAVRHLPDCAGVSLGMDRLAMLLLDADDISQVVFPFTENTT